MVGFKKNNPYHSFHAVGDRGMRYRVKERNELANAIAYVTERDQKTVLSAYDALLRQKPSFETRYRNVNSAIALAEQFMDAPTICATLLRNSGLSREASMHIAGAATMQLMDELAAATEIEEKNADRLDSETLSNIMLGSFTDVRALIVRLARRRETLRYIDQFPEQPITETRLTPKQVAQSTLDVFAPVCHKLGLYFFKWELEDHAFKILDPAAYERIKKRVNRTREERETEGQQIAQEIQNLLAKDKLEATVLWRVKHFYSIHKKMLSGKPFEKIHDKLAIRIITNTVKKCYETLGTLHGAYVPLVSEFSDYIAKPKPNSYQSIHTVLAKGPVEFEAQIRTWGMHYHAETGLAAHWQYKQYKANRFFDKNLSWAKQLLDWQQSFKNTREFMAEVNKTFTNRIFVLTPKNHVIVLPAGASVLDFAFAIHSDLGLHCHQAKVNGKTVPLYTKLGNGDHVEVSPAKLSQAKRAWLAHVVSDKALQKIRQFLGMKGESGKTTTPTGPAPNTILVSDKSRMARCCNPVHGDPIVGIRTTKRKIAVHRADCASLSTLPADKRVSIQWGGNKNDYPARLVIEGLDRPELLAEIVQVIAHAHAKIKGSQTRNARERFSAEISISVSNRDQIDKIVSRLAKLPNVQRVKRA